jgi:tRNA (guanosine-2'-O-)-methyltransferase
MRTERREAKLRSVLERRQPDLTIVLENIHDPHNVSAILRTCDAVGVASVALLYTIEPFPKIGKKSSASALKWIEREKFTSVEECFSALHAGGFAIFATHLAEQGQSLFDLDLTQKTAPENRACVW